MNGSVEYPMHGSPQRPMYGVVLRGSVGRLIPLRSEAEVRSRGYTPTPLAERQRRLTLGGSGIFTNFVDKKMIGICPHLASGVSTPITCRSQNTYPR